MSTQPPPPPQSNWPTPTGRPDDAAGGDRGGRQKWWTGGRVVAAIVVVLVLMGGAGFAGFLAGATWSGFESFAEDVTTGGDFSVGVPPDTDAAAVDGETLRVGDTITGTLSDGPVGHPLTLETAGEVTIELRSDDLDTIVAVVDESGNHVAENDDIEFGQNRNSRVEVSLPAGTHTVVVDAFGGDEGDYELSASS